MFNLFSRKKQLEKPDFSMLKTDMHSHLLPGIDDGSPDMETSLELIKTMRDFGYSKLITTPHVMWDMYKNSRDIILRKLDEVRTAMKAGGINIEIYAAAEYFLDDHVSDLVNRNEPLLTISGNMVLVEFSLAFPSLNMKDILFNMQMKGYLPVIAHPERYIYLERNKEFYQELKDTGCLFQLNMLSLSNHYGRSVHDLAQYLIKNEYYDLVGTDLHHFGHIEGLQNPSLIPPLKKLVEGAKIRNHQL
jgi:protein-tyrosine phosphatase